MRKVLITGASGMLAEYITMELIGNDFEVYGATSKSENDIREMKSISGINIVNNDRICPHFFIDNNIDSIIHTAFTRKNDINEVMDAIAFANKVFVSAKESNIQRIINISSRSVYIEPQKGELNTEESLVGGGGYIGIGKVLVENMLEALFERTSMDYTSLRVASINEMRKENVLRRPINVFVQKVIDGEDIELICGEQVMSYIDPRDVASAVLSAVCYEGNLSSIYNVGTGWKCTRTLKEIAEMVVEIGIANFGLKGSSIKISPQKVAMNAGLDIRKIEDELKWKPMYSLEDMIISVYGLYLNK